ncbi:4Fe-4S binding protein [Olsenella sp. Marseille-P4559]|uniref:4Fe-4S binding protein n=1 Tax=Olsenella sp. Marseille-P4559 TaxID=2364795 RepID=UPI0010322C40|nr:4Fe-4S binding protein [Olsenella sp. Marseille-P4559]
MDAQDCLQTLREIRDISFATVDAEGHPQIRIIDVMLVGKGALYFCTSRGKDFHAQLMREAHVAIVGMTRDYKMVRLAGEAHFVTDDPHAWIDRIFDQNPSMNDVYPGQSRYVLDPFVIDNGCIEIFDLGVSPIYRQTFSLGGASVHVQGFQITDACIGCGTCARNCPQQCITRGKPFVIAQEHCLHCGLCYENCPVQAIVKRG